MTKSLSDLCRAKRISILELEDATGLELTRVRAIYMERWTPTPTERTAIAQALGVGADEVAWGHATPIQHIYGHGPG
jgi:hypothetical protein